MGNSVNSKFHLLHNRERTSKSTNPVAEESPKPYIPRDLTSMPNTATAFPGGGLRTNDVINELKQSGNLSKDTIKEIEENDELRLDLVQYFDQNKNRDFALDFLTILMDLRRTVGISGDSLMLACFILGKHKQLEDCMKIWEAKQIDFDTFCYIDIQLVPFAGVEETIEYLKTLTSQESKNALEYVIACSKAGDFDDLINYYVE